MTSLLFGPGDRIRTCGPVVPNHVLYQTEPHPDIALYFRATFKRLFIIVYFY